MAFIECVVIQHELFDTVIKQTEKSANIGF